MNKTELEICKDYLRGFDNEEIAKRNNVNLEYVEGVLFICSDGLDLLIEANEAYEEMGE